MEVKIWRVFQRWILWSTSWQHFFKWKVVLTATVEQFSVSDLLRWTRSFLQPVSVAQLATKFMNQLEIFNEKNSNNSQESNWQFIDKQCVNIDESETQWNRWFHNEKTRNSRQVRLTSECRGKLHWGHRTKSELIYSSQGLFNEKGLEKIFCATYGSVVFSFQFAQY